MAASALNKAWLAGFIDGEGCIMISRSLGKGRVTYRYGLRLLIVQKPASPLLHIQNTYGGSLYKRKSMTGHDTHELQYNGADAYRILCDIKEFLILKQKQAEIAIDFYEKRIKRNSKTNKRYTEDELKEYDDMYANVRNLKKAEVK